MPRPMFSPVHKNHHDDIGITSSSSSERIKGTLNFIVTVLSSDRQDASFLWRSLDRQRQKEIKQRLLYYIPPMLQGTIVGPQMKNHPTAYDDYLVVIQQLIDMVSVLNYELDRVEAHKNSFLKGLGRRLRRPTEESLLRQAVLQSAVRHSSRRAYESYGVQRAPQYPKVMVTPPTPPTTPPRWSQALPVHYNMPAQHWNYY